MRTACRAPKPEGLPVAEPFSAPSILNVLYKRLIVLVFLFAENRVPTGSRRRRWRSAKPVRVSRKENSPESTRTESLQASGVSLPYEPSEE